MYVRAELRGKKIGRRLMTMLIERAGKIEGLEQILISVTTTQAAAKALYRSLGFNPFGREPRALKIGEGYIDEEFMALWLESSSREG